MVNREGFEPKLRIVFEVIERTIDKTGQTLLMPELEVATYWTSRADEPKTIFALYHEHGTMEQFHSEIKSELDLERLPSGKFATNSLVLHIGMLAYNLLRLIGQESLNAATHRCAKKSSVAVCGRLFKISSPWRRAWCIMPEVGNYRLAAIRLGIPCIAMFIWPSVRRSTWHARNSGGV